MSQQDILELLENHPEQWISGKDINKNLKISSGALSSNLKRLRRAGMIVVRSNNVNTGFLYRVRKKVN